MKVFVALCHHPVLNREGAEVTTAVTNLDIHDLARSAKSYGVSGYVIVTPIEQQRSLVSRITGHWARGEGSTYHPIRAQAIALVSVAVDIGAAIARIEADTGSKVIVVGTTARTERATISYQALRERLSTEGDEGHCVLILFGTGWGLTAAVMNSCEEILPPIEAIAGRDGYNHLSVRSAVAVILDRLLGAR